MLPSPDVHSCPPKLANPFTFTHMLSAGHFDGADLPEDAMLTTMPLAPGDIIVLGRCAPRVLSETGSPRVSVEFQSIEQVRCVWQ